MEVYYRELISEEASLDRLVDELTRVVQGADELAQAAGAHLPPEASNQIRTCLDRLKESCTRLKDNALAGAVATDKAVRKYPYSSLAIVFALGALSAALVSYVRSKK